MPCPLLSVLRLAALSLVIGAAQTQADDLDNGFENPPASARPWVYWFLLDGNITREGLTADLEAMQRVGIGGAILFDVTEEMPSGPVRFNSPEWHALLKHIFNEAARVGVQVFVQDSAGWTGSGGPWITPEISMRNLTSTRTNLSGPAHFKGHLPPAKDRFGSSQPVATLAFPALVGEGAPMPGFMPKISSSAGRNFAGTSLIDNDPATATELPAPAGTKSQYIEFSFERGYSAGAFRLLCFGKPQGFEGSLQVSDDGAHFRTVREFINRGQVLNLEFESVTARHFRWVFTRADAGLSRLQFASLDLTPVFRIPLAGAKSGLGPLTFEQKRVSAEPEPPGYGRIAVSNILDLTDKVSSNGGFEWDVPPGVWTIVQFVSAATGQMNHPARDGGHGLECDKLGSEGVRAQFHGFIEPIIQDARTNVGHSFAGVHVDSWELGHQNWSAHFREDFRRLRGYDLLPWLPVTSGRIVGSREESERFLWDMRRTVADLEATNYAGELGRLAHEHGLQVSLQPYASLGSGSFDELLYANGADVPMAEAWLQDTPLDQINLKGVASAAHTAGKAVAACETFTSWPQFAKWQNAPASLKPLADAAFCEGMNRIMFHRFVHQPWTNRAPGLTLGPFGIHYERTETWWEFSKPWHDYLSRCQFLLQQGNFVADICYLTDEGAFTGPPAREQLLPPPPDGYDYDVLAPDRLVQQMQVKEGSLILPGGMSYRTLVLPAVYRMTPLLLRKIKSLVQGGATVLGSRAEKSPGLSDYPRCDAEVKRLAGELWGECDGQKVKEHVFGKGRIIQGRTIREVLEPSSPPDFQQLKTWPGYRLKFIHRRADKVDLYFVANLNTNTGPSRLAECAFRVSGKVPEIWRPESGKIESCAAWWEENGRTIVPLSFESSESFFVIFRRDSTNVDPIVSTSLKDRIAGSLKLSRDTYGALRLLASEPGEYTALTHSGKTLHADVQGIPNAQPINGPWTLHFPPGSGAPREVVFDRLHSWTESTNFEVKYFSGPAIYTRTVTVPSGFIRPGRKVLLDLGRVEVIAEVKLNGKECGILWKEPFVADISGAVHAMGNALEIKIVNLWPNRLIGDEQFPDDCEWLPAEGSNGQPLARWPDWLLKDLRRPTNRKAFPAWKHWSKNARPLESGLLGPVVLRVRDEIELVVPTQGRQSGERNR